MMPDSLVSKLAQPQRHTRDSGISFLSVLYTASHPMHLASNIFDSSHGFYKHAYLRGVHMGIPTRIYDVYTISPI